MCQCIQAQKAREYPVLILVGQDNAGENKCLEKRLRNADWKLHVTVE
jgi:ERCC4-type nuclease